MMRQSYDSEWDYELSDTPTSDVYSKKYGFGHVDSTERKDTIYVTFRNGKAISMKYSHFHNKGELDYIKLISKEECMEKQGMKETTASTPKSIQSGSLDMVDVMPALHSERRIEKKMILFSKACNRRMNQVN